MQPNRCHKQRSQTGCHKTDNINKMSQTNATKQMSKGECHKQKSQTGATNVSKYETGAKYRYISESVS